MNHLTWKIGGEAGFGIMASGQTFSKTLSRAGYYTIETNDYPSLIRGGHNIVAVTFSDVPIYAAYKPVDILVALNKQTIDLHKDELSSHSKVIYDGESYEISELDFPKGIDFFNVPFMKIIKEQNTDVLMRNTVALGASIALLGFDFQFLSNVLTSQFSKKGEKVVSQNINAARAGFDHIQNNFKSKLTQIFVPQKEIEKKMVITGAEAVSLGAVAANMKFFACYPMTPINGILAYLAAIQEKAGFIYKQPEDEISGINMAIGASVAGVRSMVATSGGGFSLMVEGTSLAGMIEAPVVIIMGMRPGPATGLPTWTGQADLHFVLNASQGEFPRLVLAPGDPEEAFYLTAEAFNLADIYQTPVFVLVDKNLNESRFASPVFDPTKVKINRGKLLSLEEQNNISELPRYKLTDDGISPRGIPGRKGGVFRVNSDEHNEMGYSEESAQNTYNMISKRMKKQEIANLNAPPPAIYGDQGADVTLIGWGSTKGAVLEAMKDLKIENPQLKINYLHLNYINPFPSEAVSQILTSSKHPIDIEGNHNGQMADYIRMKTGFNIKDKILKFDGRQFYPEDIVEEIKKLI